MTNYKSDKMGRGSLLKLIITMSLPAMFSMLVQALYNIVDSMYVSRISGEAGAKALEAVSIAFPFQMLYMAFAIGLSIGASSLVSRKLGEGDREDARVIATTGLFLSLMHCAAFMLIGATLTKPLASVFTSDAETIEYVSEYLSIVYILSAGMYCEIYISKLFQAAGNMLIPMFAQIIGAVTNIILDKIFIFDFNMGISGAAYATVAGQFLSFAFTLTIFLIGKQEVKIGLKYLKFNKAKILLIYSIGLPAIIMNCIGSITIFVMNMLLKSSESGITALGIYFKVQSFVFMPVFGLTQGLLPILSYNYGANKKERFMKAYKISLIMSFAIMTIGFIIFQVATKPILSMYPSVVETAETMELCSLALRIISISFIPASFSVITISMFQSLGHGFKSMFISLLRQFIFLLPSAVLLQLLGGVNAIWFSYPIAEFAVIIIFIPIVISVLKKAFKTVTENTFTDVKEEENVV